jgi:hypothetical protein
VYTRWKKALPASVLLLCVLSFCVSALTGRSDEKAAFYLLHARAWELLLGALVALWPQRKIPGGGTAAFLSLAALAAIVWSVFAHDGTRVFPGATAALPCLGTAFFILAHGNGHAISPAGRLLAHPALTGLGKISYSLYLWHWPLLAVLRYTRGDGEQPLAVAAVLLLALVLAWLSWRFVETPIRSGRRFTSRSSLAAGATASVVLLLGAGLTIYLNNGFAQRLPAPASYYAEAPADRSRRPWNRFTHAVTKNAVEYRFVVYRLNADKPASFMIMGDSHAVMWLAAVDAFSEEYGVSGILLDSGVSNALVLGESVSGEAAWRDDDYRDAVLDFAQAQGISHLLVACRYTVKFGLPVLSTETASTGNQEAIFAERLEKLSAECRRRGMTVWFVENVPEYPYSVPRTLVQSALGGFSAKSRGYSVSYYENRNAPGKEVLRELASPDFRPLNVSGLMCPEDWCAPGDEGGAYYFDHTHLTRYGALRFKEVLRPLFSALGQPPPE